MATGGAVEETVAFPDWVVLDRYGRTYCHDDLDSAREAANEKKTALNSSPAPATAVACPSPSWILQSSLTSISTARWKAQPNPSPRPAFPPIPTSGQPTRTSSSSKSPCRARRASTVTRQICSSIPSRVLPPRCSGSLCTLSPGNGRS